MWMGGELQRVDEQPARMPTAWRWGKKKGAARASKRALLPTRRGPSARGEGPAPLLPRRKNDCCLLAVGETKSVLLLPRGLSWAVAGGPLRLKRWSF